MANRLLTFVTESSPQSLSPVRAEPRRAAELDRVEVLADVIGDEAVRVPAGSVGTVVAVWGEGEAFEVEFVRPVDALATVEGRLLKLVERASA